MNNYLNHTHLKNKYSKAVNMSYQYNIPESNIIKIIKAKIFAIVNNYVLYKTGE